jgi:hypothetical protein
VQKCFQAEILKKYKVDFFQCPNCEYLSAADAFWLEEAYQQPINQEDTGLINRNIYFSKIITVIIYCLFNRKGKFLDFAGGYGILTRLMRDVGFQFFWNDPHTNNLFARGFESDLNANNPMELITAIEVFEHFENPTEEVKKLFRISENLLFSTILLPDPVPTSSEWWYYGFEHGQHISFYTDKTLEWIAQHYGKKLYSCNNIHLFTTKEISGFLYNFIILMGYKLFFCPISKLMQTLTTSDAESIRQITNKKKV